MKLFLVLTFLLGAIAAPTHQSTDTITLPKTSRMGFPCANACRLFLCSNPFPNSASVLPNGSPKLLMANGVPMGGVFCSSVRPLRDVVLGEALVSPQRSGLPYVPISSYSPPGLDAPYKRNFFKVYTGSMGEQRITRRRGVGNQYENIDNLCMTLPIKQYRPTTKGGRTGALVVSTSAQDCVSMRLIASRLQFQFTWNNTDDFDLAVTEPSGDRVDLSGLESSTGGRFNRDNTGSGAMSRETITYDYEDPVVTGLYKVEISQLSASDEKPAAFKLRVVVDGVVVKSRTGISIVGETKTYRFRFRGVP